MSIKKIFLLALLSLICSIAYGEENLKSVGKFKDWESFVLSQDWNKVCFAQSSPLIRAPKKLKRDPSRLFVTSVIIGATKMEQLKSNIDSVNINLDKEIIKKIGEIQKRYPNPCP